MPKKKNKGDELDKLLKLTQLIRGEKVKVEPVPPGRGPNKWRSQDPKFAPKPEKKTDGLVEAGGMLVDPSLKDENELWRQDKLAEERARREMAARRAEAKRRAAKP